MMLLQSAILRYLKVMPYIVCPVAFLVGGMLTVLSLHALLRPIDEVEEDIDIDKHDRDKRESLSVGIILLLAGGYGCYYLFVLGKSIF